MASSTNFGDDNNSDRDYQCKFCKKTFKKAQALGGHMNCHHAERQKERMDKAMYLITSNGNLPKTISEQLSKLLQNPETAEMCGPNSIADPVNAPGNLSPAYNSSWATLQPQQQQQFPYGFNSDMVNEQPEAYPPDNAFFTMNPANPIPSGSRLPYGRQGGVINRYLANQMPSMDIQHQQQQLPAPYGPQSTLSGPVDQLPVPERQDVNIGGSGYGSIQQAVPPVMQRTERLYRSRNDGGGQFGGNPEDYVGTGSTTGAQYSEKFKQNYRGY